MSDTKKQKHILIIDDDKKISELLERFLILKQYKVTTAYSGKEGLREFQNDKPQLVLLDINMPEMDGVETLKEMKKLDPQIGIIMITGIMEEDIAKSCLDLGASDYITKPFDWNYLEVSVLSKIFPLIS